MEIWGIYAAMAAFGYALGSIPFGLLLTRATGAGDLRSIGSGNIGATNVLRTGRKGLAFVTLLLDMGKGAAAVLVAEAMMPGGGVYAGVGAFIGHCYPVWLKFNGGKGVATLIGITAALHWPIAVIFALVWLSVAFLTRYSSAAGLVGALSTPASAFVLHHPRLVIAFCILAALVVWKHRSNIARLMQGTESRIGEG